MARRCRWYHYRLTNVCTFRYSKSFIKKKKKLLQILIEHNLTILQNYILNFSHNKIYVSKLNEIFLMKFPTLYTCTSTVIVKDRGGLNLNVSKETRRLYPLYNLLFSTRNEWSARKRGGKVF